MNRFFRNWRRCPWQAALPGLVFVALAVVCAFKARGWADFDVYLDAAAAIGSGRNIYGQDISANSQYLYSPFFALALSPLCALPRWLVKFAWLMASLYWLWRCWMLSAAYLPSIPGRGRWLWPLLAGLAAVRVVGYNLNNVQVTIFLLWATLESLRLMDKNHDAAGGALLGLALTTKLLPLPFAAYLAYRGKWRGLGWTLAAVAAFLLLPALVIGWQANLRLLADWWTVINPLSAGHTIETDQGTHSLIAMLPALLSPTPGSGPAHNILSLSPGHLQIVIQTVRAGFVLLSLAFLGWPPFAPAPSRPWVFREICYLCLATPLLFPHQQKYAFLYAMPAVVYLLHHFLRPTNAPRRSPLWLGIFIFACVGMSFLIGSDILGRAIYELTEDYKLLTWSALLLVLVLGACPPETDRPARSADLTK